MRKRWENVETMLLLSSGLYYVTPRLFCYSMYGSFSVLQPYGGIPWVRKLRSHLLSCRIYNLCSLFFRLESTICALCSSGLNLRSVLFVLQAWIYNLCSLFFRLESTICALCSSRLNLQSVLFVLQAWIYNLCSLFFRLESWQSGADDIFPLAWRK